MLPRSSSSLLFSSLLSFHKPPHTDISQVLRLVAKNTPLGILTLIRGYQIADDLLMQLTYTAVKECRSRATARHPASSQRWARYVVRSQVVMNQILTQNPSVSNLKDASVVCNVGGEKGAALVAKAAAGSQVSFKMNRVRAYYNWTLISR